MWQKPLENCVVLAALCWHKYCPLSTYGPLLPLHLLLYLEKGFFMYCLCPTELNRSKLRIKGMTGDNALQPVASRSLCNCCPLCCFFSYSIMALIPLMNGGDVCCGNGTRAEKQEMSWGTGDSVPSVVVSRPWSWSRCAA